MQNKGALAGLNVLDLSRLLPGPFCSMILADHGARVIAIEDNRYKAEGLFVGTISRNKEHMALDLKTEQGKEIFYKLAKDADIIIEGFRPGVVKKLGVDFESVSKINPGVIYCSITGYGQFGPYSDRAGHDVNYLGYSGILELIGEKDRPSSIPGVQFADIAGGGMNAVIGILLALQARTKSGKGQYIDISMTDSMVSFQSIALFMQQLIGEVPQRANTLLSHQYPFYNTYETKDKRTFSVGALEFKFWKKFCEVMGAEEFIPLQYDGARKQEMLDFFTGKFKTKTADEWEEELGGADACCGKVQNLEEVLKDKHFRERGSVTDIKDGAGNIKATFGIPIVMSENPGSLRTPPVVFGENSESILAELGYTQEQIKELSDRGIF